MKRLQIVFLLLIQLALLAGCGSSMDEKGNLDTTAPILSDGKPNSLLDAGATSATISFVTDENATCKYSKSAGVLYDNMSNTLSLTAGKYHSQSIVDLSDGTTHTYYIRCEDNLGNKNSDDFVISFGIGTSTTDNTKPSITINAPTKASHNSITNTTIRVVDDTGILASNVRAGTGSTADISNFNCTQSSAVLVGCTMSIDTSGSIVIIATDNASNSATQAESEYSITPSTAQTDGFVVGHTNTGLNIPDQWITKAKSDLHIIYKHTSHGSQLVSGMDALEAFPSFANRYAWSDTSEGDNHSLSLDDRAFQSPQSDLSQGDGDGDGNGISDWADHTRDLLVDTNNYHVNVIMWSWCNIGGHNIPRYLHSMEWLIAQFGKGGTHPRAAAHPVKFIFMTAHANGYGENDSSDTPNRLIRQHVLTHERILFDFSDIENYDPDGNYYLDRRLDDALNYDDTVPYNSGPKDANWATEYLTANDGGELDQLTHGEGITGYDGVRSCAHSPQGSETADAKLNCVLKGRAVWYLFARLAGWDGL